MAGGIRAGDRDREATVLRLRAAHAEGRIDTEELEERIARAQAAATIEDLDTLEADLPARSLARVDVTTGTPWWPGRRAFSERKLLDAPVADVREAFLAYLVPAVERRRYELRDEREDAFTFAHRRPGQLGADRVTIRLRDAGDRRTLVLVHGTAPLGLRRAFARLDR
jgi:hypothetical protein